MTREQKIDWIYKDQCTGTETEPDAQLDELMNDFGYEEELEGEEESEEA